MTVNRPVLRVRPPDAGAGEWANGGSSKFSLGIIGNIVTSSVQLTVCLV